MAIGRVKWFSNEKGYGFLEAVESKQDVFVHFSDIVMEGYKTLKEDAMVFFVLEMGAKGPGARHVCPLQEAESDGLRSGLVGSDMRTPAQPVEAGEVVQAESLDMPPYADERSSKRRKNRHARQSAMA